MRNPGQFEINFGQPTPPERPPAMPPRETKTITGNETVPLKERARKEALDFIHKEYPSENLEDLNFAQEETDEKGNLVSIIYIRPGTTFKEEAVFRAWFQEGQEGRVDKLKPESKRSIM